MCLVGVHAYYLLVAYAIAPLSQLTAVVISSATEHNHRAAFVRIVSTYMHVLEFLAFRIRILTWIIGTHSSMYHINRPGNATTSDDREKQRLECDAR